jgi:hypothetical protein
MVGRLSHKSLVVFLFTFGIILSGCGGGNGGGGGGQPISVSISPAASQSIDQGQTIQFTASVANDSSSKGVTWSQTGGALSGQTATAATFTAGSAGSASVTATSAADTTKSATTNITIAAMPSITTTTLPAATVGQKYSQTISATGGTGSLTYSISTGALPTGLTLTGNTISGTPTTAGAGTPFTVKVTDASTATGGPGSATQQLSITVNSATTSLTVTTSSLPTGVVGSAYSATLQSSGGTAPVSWSVVGTPGLPAGLSLNASTGAVTGTPTTAASTNVTFQAADSGSPQQTAQATLTITVAATLSITTTSPLPGGSVGGLYSTTLQSSGGTGAITWSVVTGAWPSGLALSSAGAITGTPTATGTASVTVQATDSGSPQQTAQATLSLTVAQLLITTTSLLNPMQGETYSQTLLYTDSGGTPPVTWSISAGALPTGFNLDPSTGAITASSPVTAAAGTTTFTVQATDGSTPAQTATRQLSLTVTLPATTVCTTETGNESMLSGQYAVYLTGFDASGPAGMLGSFTADGTGKITGGIEDTNSTTGIHTALPVVTATSFYSVGSDQRGCLTLTTSQGTRVFHIALGMLTNSVSTQGRLIEFDNTGTNISGTFQLQQSSAFSNTKVAGNYALVANAALPSSGGFFAAVGQLVLTTGTPSGTVAGVCDMNFNGTVNPGSGGNLASPLTLTPGTYQIGGNGRGIMSFTAPLSPTPTLFHLVVYVLNATQMYLMSTDTQSATDPLFSGFIGQQTGLPYATSSLGTTSVLFASGQTQTGGSASQVEAGIFTPDGAGDFTLAGDQNSNGTVSALSQSGSYSVDANTGRVLITNSGSASPNMVMYMVLNNWAYALSTDNNVMVGNLEPQTGSPFSNATLSGIYTFGTIVPVVSNSPLKVGQTTYTPASASVNSTFDVNEGGFLSIDNVVSSTYSVDPLTGRVVSPAGGTTLDASYLTNSGTVISFGVTATDTNPTIQIMDQ